MMMRTPWFAVPVVLAFACTPAPQPFQPVVVDAAEAVRRAGGFADERGEALLVSTAGAPLRIRADGARGTLNAHPGNQQAVGEVRAVFQMGRHRALIAGAGGLFVAASGWLMEPLWTTPLSSEGVVGAAEGTDGSSWIAHSSGLFRVRNGELAELKLSGESVTGITAIAAGRGEDGGEAIWFARPDGLSALVAVSSSELVVRRATAWGGDQEEISALVALGVGLNAPAELWALGKAGLVRLGADGWKKVDPGAGPVSGIAGAGRVLWATAEEGLLRFDADEGSWTRATGLDAATLLAADAAGGAWVELGGALKSVQPARVPRVLGLDQNERVVLTEVEVTATFPPGPEPLEVVYRILDEEIVTHPPAFSMGGVAADERVLPYSLLGFPEGAQTLRATAHYADGSSAERVIPFDFAPVDNTPLSWATDIQPIHVARCALCHEGGPGHDLSGYEAWRAEAARIAQAVRDRRMPADGPLDPSEITTIQRWAQSGANP